MKMKAKIVYLAVGLALVFSLLGPLAVPGPLIGGTPALAATATIEVSQPIQVTNDSHYERGQSIACGGGYYWLFYGRSASVTDNYATGNPDVHDYALYYKKATTVAGLPGAGAAAVATPLAGYLGETGAAYFGGEIWGFATVDVGASAELDGWYSSDGSSWAQVGPIISGLSDGQAHFDAVSFNGELWVVEGSGDFNTKHSATPKNLGSWSAPLNVDAALTGGLVHFFVDGSDLYLAINASSINYIYKYNSGTVAWDKIDETAPPERYDPTLFKVGSRYVFAQAPWVSPRQYIIAWSGTTLDGSFFDRTGDPVSVTEGQYGGNGWVDMWPIGFTDQKSDSYLFFTSERNPNDPSSEITGNIWYLPVDWTVTNDHYTYIQEAVNAATSTTINVAAGTYTEAVTIPAGSDLTLVGAGQDVSTWIAPADDPSRMHCLKCSLRAIRGQPLLTSPVSRSVSRTMRQVRAVSGY
jgi:hypothetical protein